ncbi:MAG: M24 family metallopeptidase [Candidatus Aenigmatarchaeota archaeon]
MGMIKTREEIEFLKKSAKIANSCLPLIKKLLGKDISEKELARGVREKIYSQGGKLAFRILVACGKRSAMIHPRPAASNKKISGLGYIDFGVSYKGYKTDVTVPFVKGKISEKEEIMVRVVTQAYNLALKNLKKNMSCFKLFEIVDKFLRKNGFKMEHSLGHGVGKKIHELPTIGIPRSKLKKLSRKKRKKLEKLKKMKFEEGMVFTIEPAVYVKGLGGCRLENTILLTKKGPISLTNSKLIRI